MFQETNESMQAKQRRIEFKAFCDLNATPCKDYLPIKKYKLFRKITICKHENVCDIEKTKAIGRHPFVYFATAKCDKKGNITYKLKREIFSTDC